MVFSEASCQPIPDAVPFEVAALIGCDFERHAPTADITAHGSILI